VKGLKLNIKKEVIMTTFLVISGVILWIIIFWIVIILAYDYYDEYLIKRAFKRTEKRYLDNLFKDATLSIVYKEIKSDSGVIIKAGDVVRIVPHNEFKREYKVLTKDYRFIEGVTPDKLEINEEEV